MCVGHSVNKEDTLGSFYFREKQKCLENFSKENAVNL